MQHLNEVEVDIDPRQEAFWFVGGIEPPELTKRKRKGTAWQKDMADEPINRQFQYVGKPLLALRHTDPLEPLQNGNSVEISTTDLEKIPRFSLDPRTIGYAHDYRHGTTIPGTQLCCGSLHLLILKFFRILAWESTRIWCTFLFESQFFG